MIGIQNPYVAQREAAESADRGEIVDGYGEAALRGLLLSLRTGAQAFEHGAQVQLLSCASDLRVWAAAYRARADAIASGAEQSDDARTDAVRWQTVANEIDQFAADWIEESHGYCRNR